MAEVIRMPRMSDTMEEGVIVEWHVKVGDKIEPGDLMAEVETDKATMELESYQEGTLLYIGVKKGDAVPVEGIIAVLGDKGEDFQSLLDAEPAAKESSPTSDVKEEVSAETAPPPKPEPVSSPPAPAPAVTVTTETNGRMKVSPLARKMASERGLNLSQIKGTGDDGRIIKRDIESFTGAAASEAAADPAAIIELPEVVGVEGYDEVPVSQMRKTIAKRLVASKFSAPHFYLTMEINMDKAVEARKSMNEVSVVKISFNDMIIKSAALALRVNPKVNAAWMEDKIRYNKHIHIGIAVAVEEGLLVPVIKFADTKTLSHLAAESRQNAQKAIAKQLQPEDWEGNTFTISNLGMFDIDEFTAIINSPEGCILAVGKIKEVPAVIDGEIRPSHRMKITLSCDHRVVDGALGAKFLQTLKSFLEDPVRLLI